jgi:hypothetical protein
MAEHCQKCDGRGYISEARGVPDIWDKSIPSTPCTKCAGRRRCGYPDCGGECRECVPWTADPSTREG